jgi:cellulose synthase/poly-beta-1,6-N-acetylglucosamine synthase-like glycosyltransferase
MGQSGPPKDSDKPQIGHAVRLRPASAVASSSVALLLALMFGATVTTGFNLGTFLLDLTVWVAWLSVAVGLLRLLACMVPPRRTVVDGRDQTLPTYTIILPLFREAHMVMGLKQAMTKLDYPADKLDIIFVCEQEDFETITMAEAVSQPPFRTLIVPPSRHGGPPQTKPRALNYALNRSDSELVTIFDAEDRPHPLQLRQAARAFMDHPDWVALQAPLDYFNTQDSWLSAQFGLEYAALFHVLLPFYDRLGLPFPLGGTSNHMRRSALIEVGGWDPHNVTEDADLAFRLSALGNRIGWIDRPTREEAVSHMRPWLKQRSRWLKGYIQTWLVHMNSPVQGGWRRAMMLQLTLGLSLMSVFFFAPVMLALGLFSLAKLIGITSLGLPSLYMGALGFSLLCGMIIGAVGAIRARQFHLLWHVPFMPLYWLLLFPPLIQAIIELQIRPFHWHKTEHGVTGAPPELAGE